MSREAILSAENSEKSLGGQGYNLNPAGELTVLPQTSDVVWVLGQDRSETKKIGLGLGGFVSIVLWNTMLSRSSS